MNIKEKLRLTMKQTEDYECHGCHYHDTSSDCMNCLAPSNQITECFPEDSEGNYYPRIYVKVERNGD